MMGSGPHSAPRIGNPSIILLEMQWINSASIHGGEYFLTLEITEQERRFFIKSSGRRPLDDRAIRFIGTLPGETADY